MNATRQQMQTVLDLVKNGSLKADAIRDWAIEHLSAWKIQEAFTQVFGHGPHGYSKADACLTIKNYLIAYAESLEEVPA